MSRRKRTDRAAFTLPELLVVVTVTLVLMSILVQAATIITSTVSAAKAQGDFVGQQRAALAVLRRDLQANHFEDEDGKPNQGRRLSDQRTDRLSWYNAGTAMTPDWRINTSRYTLPRGGYFWASAAGVDSTWNFDEGSDASGFNSTRSGNHALQFTIIVPGGSPDNTLTATDVPMGGTTTATCAEVAYFLVDNGATPNGVRQYKLIRRQRIAARNADDKPAYSKLVSDAYLSDTRTPKGDPGEVVAGRKTGATSGTNPYPIDVFNLSDLTRAQYRFGGADSGAAGGGAIGQTSYRYGEDVLHHHVISFELKFTGSSEDNSWPRPLSLTANGNTDFPYDILPYDGKYDTFSAGETNWDSASNLAGSPTGTSASPLKRIRITGVQIRLRCWNPSSRATRQTTIAVDL